MANLSTVSETALLTLRARATQAQSEDPILRDEMGVEVLARIQPLLPTAVRERIMNRAQPPTMISYAALRARRYDRYTQEFLARHPDGLVVSLGCGFDTRYWRLSDEPWNYVEVDLPAVIDAKRQVLGDELTYPTISGSVLEEGWIAQVAAMQTAHVLLLAEGLFMYLPPEEVKRTFSRIAETFTASEIVFEVVNKRYTEGKWKKVVERKMKRSLGTAAGSSYQFGIHEASDVESFGPGIRALEEWCYYEDPDVRPRVLRLVRNWRLMSRVQWTVRAAID